MNLTSLHMCGYGQRGSLAAFLWGCSRDNNHPDKLHDLITLANPHQLKRVQHIISELARSLPGRKFCLIVDEADVTVPTVYSHLDVQKLNDLVSVMLVTATLPSGDDVRAPLWRYALCFCFLALHHCSTDDLIRLQVHLSVPHFAADTFIGRVCGV